MDSSLVIGVASILVAAVSTYIGYRFGRRAELSVPEWMRELRGWAGLVLCALTNAAYGMRDGFNESSKAKLIQELSWLVEIGRLYFPNQERSPYRLKSSEFSDRGYRHAALDPLVVAISILEGQEESPYELLVEVRRTFVLILSGTLKPGRYNKAIAKIIGEGNDVPGIDGMRGLVSKQGQIPPGEKLLLQIVKKRVQDRKK